MTYDVSFIPERPEERELAGALDRFALACIASSGDVGAPYLDNLYTLDEAGREVAVAVTALLARADHIGDAADMMQPAHIDREAWEPCGACKDGEITIHVPEFRAMAVCNQHMDHEAFGLTFRLNFCPWCGRPLTPEAWAELEKRVRG